MTTYLDNASTSHPKPRTVYQAVEHALVAVGANPGRGAHVLARKASAIITQTREKASRLLGISQPNQLIFTSSATESINVALKGWLNPGDRVLLSSMEHNAVVRPLTHLSHENITIEKIKCGPGGSIDLDDLKKHLTPPPKLGVLLHASNVNGALQPISEVARLFSQAGVPLLLDAAQTAGIQPIMAEEWNLGMLVCSGHKSLLGPQGVGLLYIRPDLNLRSLIEGGTGSNSEHESQPDFYPDCFESGTLNLPGIAGLGAGIDYIEEMGAETILNNELKSAAFLEEGLSALPGVKILRPDVRGTGVVSFIVEGINPSDLGHILDEAFDIAVRTGLHCAPFAHRTLGTFPEGTIRVAPGCFTQQEDLEHLLQSLDMILQQRSRRT